MEFTGFRVLAYDGEAARIDIALQASTTGNTLTLSMAYDLVWQDGDRKPHTTDPHHPTDAATITDASGYVP